MKQLNRLGLAAVAMAVAVGPALAADDKPLTERNESVGSAVATPVEDLNLKKTKIPEVLQRAVENPYDLRTTTSCEAIATEVAALDHELGDDHDTLVLAQETKDKSPKAGALLKAGVAAVIPYRGLVRQITGAAQHEKDVDEAIDAGFARRGFLKGRALEMNCAPPASPAWYTPRPEKNQPTLAQTAPAPVEAPTSAPVAEQPNVPAPTVSVSSLPPIPGAAQWSVGAPDAVAAPSADGAGGGSAASASAAAASAPTP